MKLLVTASAISLGLPCLSASSVLTVLQSSCVDVSISVRILKLVETRLQSLCCCC